MGCGCSGNAVDRDLRRMEGLAKKAALMRGEDFAVLSQTTGKGYRIAPASALHDGELCRVVEYRSSH